MEARAIETGQSRSRNTLTDKTTDMDNTVIVTVTATEKSHHHTTDQFPATLFFKQKTLPRPKFGLQLSARSKITF